MSDSLKLAAVIPCYNHDRYVGRAIESILNQTRKADRVLVIDDGSRDASVEVLRRYEGEGIEIAIQENAGAHQTLNRLVEEAARDCDVVSILNSDDFYEPGRFEKCLAHLEAHPGVDVVSSELQVVDAESNPLDEKEPRAKWFRAIWSMSRLAERDYPEWLGLGNFPATTSNVLARAGFLKAHPFRPYRFNHDYYFLAQAVLRDRFALVDEPLLNYRVHGSNTINTDPGPLMNEMLRMHLDLYRDLAEELADDEHLRARFFRYMRAAWDNVSSFHAGLFQVALAGLAARSDEAVLRELVEGFNDERHRELRVYPNKALVNTHDGETPLVIHEGLAEKCQALLDERSALKQEARMSDELRRIQQVLLKSRWVALGRIFGAGREALSDRGKTAKEKMNLLRAGIEASWWIRLGRKLGLVKC